jgi:hypothetical protein
VIPTPAPTPRPHGRRLVALGAALAALAASAPAPAAGSKEAQAQKALKQALDEDYLQTRFDDAEQKIRAALQMCGKSCSIALRARLHAALASVLAGGKKELGDARDEFVEALSLDPKVQPNPDLLSTEVAFAFEQAKKQLHLASGAPADTRPKPPKPPLPPGDESPAAGADDKAAAPPEPPPAAPPASSLPDLKNWITLSFSPDVAIVSGTDVCTGRSQATSHFYCARADGTQYAGTPTLGNGDEVSTGAALATMRLTLGYERLVHPNVTLGARIGFAFNGANVAGGPFLPVHAEGRLGAWLGHDPFGHAGVRPYFVLAGGLEEVDTRVSVQVLENGLVCGAQNPASTASPCTVQSPGDNITSPEQRLQTLTVYKQSGLGFAALGFGVQFAPAQRVALHLAVRGAATFPSVTAVISPEAGFSVGF